MDAVDITLSEDITVNSIDITEWTVPTAGDINLVQGVGAANGDITETSPGVLRWPEE